MSRRKKITEKDLVIYSNIYQFEIPGYYCYLICLTFIIDFYIYLQTYKWAGFDSYNTMNIYIGLELIFLSLITLGIKKLIDYQNKKELFLKKIPISIFKISIFLFKIVVLIIVASALSPFYIIYLISQIRVFFMDEKDEQKEITKLLKKIWNFGKKR